MTTAPNCKRTRIAPTPSGYLHLGNVLSFIITATLAERTGAKILLRIDDLDRVRAEERYVQDIFDTLHFLELPWNDGPADHEEYRNGYSQIHRMPLYNAALQQLQDNGDVYACTCSRAQVHKDNPSGIYTGTCRNKQLPLDTKDACWRLHTGNAGMMTVKTLNGNVSAVLPADMHDIVVRKRDGYPAYQLSSVVDDLHFGVDLIVRGSDLWHSTIVQHYIAARLGRPEFANILFHHHPLLMSPTGNKLSKSAGDTSIQQLHKEHKEPADVHTMIARILGIDAAISHWEELSELLAI